MAKIGKNVLENLTQAMYSDSRIVYREYIQNSTDQIDVAKKNNSFPGEELQIYITIDPKKRNIYIEDNANGIPQNEVKKRLGDVADSEKIQGDARGFRGIGRLGGIGYCKELRFVTSYRGEDKQTTMIWDADKLNEIIHDPNNHDSAEKVLKDIIKYQIDDCEKEKHFFKVEMLGVNEEDEKLLDIDDIEQYISEVAPVDFDSSFLFASKIKGFIEDHDEVPPLRTYPIFLRELGGELTEIKKKYPNRIYRVNNDRKESVDEVTNIQADLIRDESGRAIAWIWYAITGFKGVINEAGNPMRGLRLRQFNMLIGDRETLSPEKKFFKEGRGNHYFLGEVHTLAKELRPNARRDYFIETPVTRDFENSLQEYVSNNLESLYRDGSKLNSAYNKLKKLQKLEKDIKERQKKGSASDVEDKKYAQQKKEAVEKAKQAVKDIEKINKKAKENPNSAIAKVTKYVTKQNEINDIHLESLKNEVLGTDSNQGKDKPREDISSSAVNTTGNDTRNNSSLQL